MLSSTASAGTPSKKTLPALQQSISKVFLQVKQPAQATATLFSFSLRFATQKTAKDGSCNLYIIHIIGSHNLKRIIAAALLPACKLAGCTLTVRIVFKY